MSKRILIIEDNILNLKLTKKLISLAGLHPLTAYNAEDGLKIARTEKPDLILMDIQLPGINGLDATRIIKNDKDISDIPVIALSAHAMQEEMNKAREAGCCGYITKPLETRTFLKTIQAFLPHDSEPEAEDNDNELSMHKPRILLADADPENRKFVRTCLAGLGAEIINAAGENGIATSMNVFPDSIDLLIIGFVMLEKNRFEAARKFREDPATAEIPVLAITNDPFETEKAWSAGADAIISNPLNEKELLDKVSRLLFTKNPLAGQGESENVKGNNENSGSYSVIVFIGMDEKNIEKIMSSLDDEHSSRALMFSEAKDALEYIRSGRCDVICSPAVLQDSDAISLCRTVKNRETSSGTQIMILSKNMGTEKRILAINAGCDDYIEMPVSMTEMTVRLKALIKKKKELDILSARAEDAMSSSITDRLTNLYSYSYFRHYLDLEVRRSIRQGYSLALMILELNDFGRYTEIHGSASAEKKIKQIASVITKNIRAVDFPSRFSIHKFAIIFPYTIRDDAETVVERIIKELSDTTAKTEDEDGITFSMGLVMCPDEAIDSVSLIHRANSLMIESRADSLHPKLN